MPQRTLITCVDSILEGVFEGLYGIGYMLVYDDRADLLNPNAHPGIHHHHWGTALMLASQGAHFLDMVSRAQSAMGVTQPPLSDTDLILASVL